jgi:catechol 2,3-dioxygenase-like lactoylglutathione lyase family enzyme
VTDESIKRNESAVPMLPCTSPEETLEFYQALGFRPTWRQTKPYLYMAFEFSGFEIHFKDPPKGLDPAEERSGGCLIEVDSIAPYHTAFKEAMKQAYGKVLVKGRPRITRYRAGASRFTLIDPSGNSIVFIRRDEPEELEYGGSKNLQGLAKALDNARIFRDFKNDDKSAARIIEAALRRYGDQAEPVERAIAFANLIELFIALEAPDKVEEFTYKLREVPLPDADRRRVENEITNAALLSQWLAQK